ncbi:NitT/TauT family transport system substrate-binding protein [Natronocella acetinitrilica]|uniref:Thiamine pyrimidine synthase n=1 Tax=Natronocella acetinitrilica TaxID=414046 RepID=A0AAE3G0Y3_9GAMM|nr:ABC transporter substrate-binding protein [Natronocella acetinitrilica]MCP1673397.1 NitT/TauT family transport system substrate-binding protein [Natronocella acetinitrilica]
MKAHFTLRQLVTASLMALVVAVGPSIAAAADLKSVSVRLDWRPGTQHSPFFHGRALGYYEEEGIDLRIITGSGSSDVVTQVGSRAVEFGLADALVISQAIDRGVPIIAIGGYYQRTPIVVMSPQENPVREPSDLLNQVRLGHNRGSATGQGLTAMLAANNIAMEDLTLIPIGFGVEPLLAGQVDAMMGFAQNQPVEAELAGMPIHSMPISDHGVESYGLTLVTNPQWIESDPDLVQGFVRATLRGLRASMEDPAAAIASVMANVEELDEELERRKLEITLDYWLGDDGEEESIGRQTDERWARTIDVALELGLIDRPIDPAVIYTQQFIGD